MKMDELIFKLGISAIFGPAYSPWLNRVNEWNHYSCDIIIKKIMEQYKKLALQDAVDIAI